ncbi:ATP-binding protein [Rhizobium sp. FKL33]|uniref:ATP-binding protein n=1 Tax=Rhizobium sp. FKL33 TaxID=2562307 RepID=UPI0010C14E41|nr:ATP-binding protein [Rhizobium sp. FKL33]
MTESNRRIIAAKTGRPETSGRAMVWAMAMVAGATLIALPFRSLTDPDTLTLVYMTAVVATALRHGFGPSIVASVLSVAAFNFVFVEPYYTFDAFSAEAYFTFAIMFATSLIVAGMTSGLSRRMSHAGREQARTRRLLDFSRDLSRATSPAEIHAAAVAHLAPVYEGNVSLHLADAQETRFWQGPERDRARIIEAIRMNAAANLAVEEEIWIARLEAAGETAGWLALVRMEPGSPSGEASLELETLAALLAGAVARAEKTEEAARAEAAREAETLRNVLLSSLSHDLRTPLTVLGGTIAALVRMRRKLPREAMDEVQSLSRQIAYLQKFTGNLLKISAISSGDLKLNRQVYTIQEIVGAALARMSERKGGRRIRTAISGDIPLVEIDGALIEQVVANLVENAIEHTGDEGEIAVELATRGAFVQISISDNGPGLSPGDEELVFERFRTGSHIGSDRKSPGASGLGLAICRGVVEAHGGRIDAGNNPGGGARFYFTLPALAQETA